MNEASVYYSRLLRVPGRANSGLLLLVPIPVLAGRNFLGRLLIRRRQSGLVQLGMLTNLFALVALLLLGASLDRAQGVILAAWATLGSQILEVLVLHRLVRQMPVAVPVTQLAGQGGHS